jgi:hypothetical protein
MIPIFGHSDPIHVAFYHGQIAKVQDHVGCLQITLFYITAQGHGFVDLPGRA